MLKSNWPTAEVASNRWSVIGEIGLAATTPLSADTEEEINEGCEADHEADVGVEAFECREGEKAYRTVVRYGVAKDGESGGAHGGGGGGRRQRSVVRGRMAEGKKRGGGRGDRPPVCSI